LNRQQFVNLATRSVATCLLSGIASAANNAAPAIKAIRSMALPTFDPQSVSALAEQLFAGRGTELNKRQFEYTWLRAVCVRYADFWKVTEDALVFAAKTLKTRVKLSGEKRQQLMQAMSDSQATWRRPASQPPNAAKTISSRCSIKASIPIRQARGSGL